MLQFVPNPWLTPFFFNNPMPYPISLCKTEYLIALLLSTWSCTQVLHSEKRIVDGSCQLVFGFPKKERKIFGCSLPWLVLALTFSLVDVNFLIVLAAKGTFRKARLKG
jgi:hypothetical protein